MLFLNIIKRIFYIFFFSFGPHDEIALDFVSGPASFIEATSVETSPRIASVFTRDKAHRSARFVYVAASVRPLEEDRAPFSEARIGKRLGQEVVPRIVVLVVPFVSCGWERACHVAGFTVKVESVDVEFGQCLEVFEFASVRWDGVCERNAYPVGFCNSVHVVLIHEESVGCGPGGYEQAAYVFQYEVPQERASLSF